MKKYILPTAFISTLFSTFSTIAMDRRAPRTLTELLGVPVGNHWFEEDEFQSQERDMVSQYGLISEISSNSDTPNTTQRNLESNALTLDLRICDAAQNYNKTTPLIKFQESPHFYNFLHSPSIHETIKTYLALSSVCTYFNKPEYFGSLLKKYDSETRNLTLDKLLASTPDREYWHRRRAMLLLIYADADYNSDNSLISHAICFDDLDMTTLLFQRGADANALHPIHKAPHFFNAKTLEMILLCVNNKADLTMKENFGRSVLWYYLSNNLWDDNTPAIVSYYIDNGIGID